MDLFSSGAPLLAEAIFAGMGSPLASRIAMGFGLAVGLILGFRSRRGTPLHELLHLPDLWWRLHRVKEAEVSVETLYYGAHPRQYVLICAPRAGLPVKPFTVVFFHGGAWRFGKPEWFLPYAAFFSRRGYPVVLASCRRVPLYDFRDMGDDVQLVLQLASNVSAQHGWARGGLLLGGMSSGGHLVAHALLRPSWATGTKPLAGGFVLGAPLALEHLPGVGIRTWLAGRAGSARFRQANPVEHLDGAHPPPLLVVHGTHDGLVSFQCAEDFVHKAWKAGHQQVAWETLPGGTHLEALSWLYSDNDLRRRILDWLAEREQEVG